MPEIAAKKLDVDEKKLRRWLYIVLALWVGAFITPGMYYIYSRGRPGPAIQAQAKVILDMKYSDWETAHTFLIAWCLLWAGIAVTSFITTVYAYQLQKRLLASGLKGYPAWRRLMVTQILSLKRRLIQDVFISMSAHAATSFAVIGSVMGVMCSMTLR